MSNNQEDSLLFFLFMTPIRNNHHYLQLPEEIRKIIYKILINKNRMKNKYFVNKYFVNR